MEGGEEGQRRKEERGPEKKRELPDFNEGVCSLALISAASSDVPE